METNPISFSQIFNFGDAPASVNPAIEAMKNLSLTSKEFFDIVSNGNLDKLTASVNEIKAELTGYKKTLEDVDLTQKEGQKTVVQAVSDTQRYQEMLVKLNSEKQATTKITKETQGAMEMLNAVIASQIKSLADLEAQGKKDSEAYTIKLRLIQQNTTELEKLTASIKETASATGMESAEMKQLQIILEKIITTTAKLNVAQTEENKTLVDQTVALGAVNKELKLNSVINDENAGQYNKAIALQKLQIIQYGKLKDVHSAEGLALKEEIDANDLWIKQNSYKSAAQRLTIGDYKNARDEMTLTREAMVEMTLQDKAQTEEYAVLEARLIALSIANKQVAASINEVVKTEALVIAENRAQTGSLDQLRAKLALLQAEWNTLGPNARNASSDISQSIESTKKDIADLTGATEAAEAKKQAAMEATTVKAKILAFVQRDLLRLVAGFLTIYPIMALIDAMGGLLQVFFKTGDEIKSVRESFEKFEVELKLVSSSVSEVTEKERLLNDELLTTAANANISIDVRTEAINKYRAAYGHLLDRFTDEQLMMKDIAVTEKIQQADSLKAEEEVAKKKLEIRGKAIQDLTTKEAELTAKKDNTAFYHPIDKANINQGIAEAISKRHDLESGLEQDGIAHAKKMMSLIELEGDLEAKAAKYNEFINEKKNENLISQLRGKIASLEQQLNNRDYEKYGITSTDLTKEQTIALKKRADIDPEFKNKISELQNAKDELEVLLGGKDPKGSRKSKDPYPAQLAEEKAFHEKYNDLTKGAFEQSQKSFNDYKLLYETEDAETKRHYTATNAIIDAAEKSGKETSDKIKEWRQQSAKDEQKTYADIEAARRRDIDNLHEYEERKIRIIEDTNNKLRQANEQSNKIIEDARIQKEKTDLAHKTGRRLNIIGAFFGTGGSTPYQDYQDDLSQKDLDIQKSGKDVSANAKAGELAAGNLLAAKLKVDEDARTPDADKSPTQLRDASVNLESYKKAAEEKETIDKKFADSAAQWEGKKADKQAAIDKQAKDQKIAEAEIAMQAIQKIGQSAYDLQKKRIQQQMADTQALAQFEMTLAGNNTAAKIKIAEAEQAKLRQLKRQEAETAKQEAIYNVVLSTAQGIAKAWDYGPVVGVVLSGIIAAVGLVQISNITSAPLPAYKGGRSSGPAEFARVNEAGPELLEKDGQFRIAGGGKDTVTMLQAGERVYPYEKSMKMMNAAGSAKNWMDTLLDGTGAHRQIETDKQERMLHAVSQRSMSREDMDYLADRMAKSIPAPILRMPAEGVVGRFARMQEKHVLPK